MQHDAWATPMPGEGTFCAVHRFPFLPGEQRFIMGYYSQGVKIHYTDNADGTRTYMIAASDRLRAVGNATRGTDVLTWPGPTHPIEGGCGDDPTAADYMGPSQHRMTRWRRSCPTC